MSQPSSKTGVQRQREYMDRLKAKGYVQLSSVWCPAAYRDQLKVEIAKLIAEFESKVSQF